MDIEYIPKFPISDSLKCNICFEMFNNPVTLKNCGHTFCEICINQWKNNCPTCRSSIHNGYIPAYNIKSMINNTIILCSNENCKKACSYDKIPNHLQICYFQDIKCDYCAFKGIRKKHLINEYNKIMEKIIENNKIELTKKCQEIKNINTKMNALDQKVIEMFNLIRLKEIIIDKLGRELQDKNNIISQKNMNINKIIINNN
jgi:Zinc finger, C3HC4 type (RING finger)